MNKKFFFGYRAKISWSMVVIFFLLFSMITTSTIAYFYDSDYGKALISMSGKIEIQAVGKGDSYDSIEDTETSNLIISLDNYDVLIPGMLLDMDVNCRVTRSTTHPLLRAKLEVFLNDVSLNSVYNPSTEELSDENFGFLLSMYNSLKTIVINNKWHLHTDGYFYYIGDVDQKGATGGNLLLKEVYADDEDDNIIIDDDGYIVEFINSDVKFPEQVDSTYSGQNIDFKITFQAIQNYITDTKGNRIDNTISNSIVVFNNEAPIDPEAN